MVTEVVQIKQNQVENVKNGQFNGHIDIAEHHGVTEEKD